MLNRLNEAEKRYLEIEEALANPETASNQAEFTKAMKEYKNLTPIIEKYRDKIANFDALEAYKIITGGEA